MNERAFITQPISIALFHFKVILYYFQAANSRFYILPNLCALTLHTFENCASIFISNHCDVEP